MGFTSSMVVDRLLRRHQVRTPQWSPDEVSATWQLCSLALDYPDASFVERLPLLQAIAAGLPDRLSGGLTAYVTSATRTALGELQRDYVDTFDVTRRCALHLTYATCGDTRRRGVALVQFKQAFRASGVEFGDADAELPDFLPAVLEFAALTDPRAGWRLLTAHRVSIELLHRALRERDSRWLPVVESLRATLPVLDGTEEEALAALIAAGPPTEDVGLDPALDTTTPYAVPTHAGSSVPTTIPLGGPR